MKVLRVVISSDKKFYLDLMAFLKSLGFKQNGKDFVLLSTAKESMLTIAQLTKELFIKFDYEEPVTANDIFWVYYPTSDRKYNPNITIDRHVSGTKAVLALQIRSKT